MQHTLRVTSGLHGCGYSRKSGYHSRKMEGKNVDNVRCVRRVVRNEPRRIELFIGM